MPQSIAARLFLDVGVAALIIATYGYSVRKWRERSLDRRRAQVEESEPHRIEQLDGAIAGLQAHVHAGKMTRRPEIVSAARQAIAQAGLSALYAPEVSPGGAQGWHVEVRPRTLPGSLDLWLKVHAALALLSVPVVLVHAAYSLGGPLTSVLLTVYLATTASGLLAAAIRWLGSQEPGGSGGGFLLPGRSRAREIDEVRERLECADAAIAEALPGTPRSEAHAAQRARLVSAHPVAVSRLQLLDACLVLHVPLAAAALGLAITHFVVSMYY